MSTRALVSRAERTIVSTNTINLQEQLVGRDLPLLRRALRTKDHEPTFALLKGWRNYLCRLRLDMAASSQQSLLEGDKLEIAAMAHNNTDKAVDAKVRLMDVVKSVRIGAHGHERVSIPFTAKKTVRPAAMATAIAGCSLALSRTLPNA